ncbi:AsmA family protein [Herminiimonas fonticola]|uniref:Uncharacterized protein involved in outer membrane biogenesis n=1 Tax=Herminiimonas fonticola TaxID=303380 RepID=A0A4R6G6U9_9BURK|nr:AsmA family protein [Herminiimonas fonticola]RBA24288.1 AsmA-like C-terminal region [Herminiimonas fonticola]TDN90289.1 uncharacterized protein involved in outer membrane biogenesis [Herminiimonas fonticola]
MNARRKVLLWVISGLLLAFVIASISLSMLVDGKHLKELARDKAQQEWSRDLTIGDIALQLFPYPQLHAKHVMLSNPDWARDKYLIEAADMQVEFAFLPLLTGKFVVSGLHFDGLKTNFNIANDGRRSWDFPRAQASSSISMALTSLNAKNSHIRFRHAENEPRTWQVQNLRVDGHQNLHDVEFDMQLERDQYLLQLNGKLDDLSSLGQEGAVTKGVIHAKSGQASATISGKMPLDTSLSNYDLLVTIEAPSTQEFFGFLGVKQDTPAPLKASVALQAVNRKTDFKDLKLQLGKMNLSGEGQINLRGKTPVFSAQLQADRVDMIQTFLDAGQPPLPPKKAGQLFRDNPFAWHLLVALNGTQGKVDANIAALKLRSGIEVTDASAKMTFNDDRLTVNKFSGKLLGGAAAGDAVFNGSRKTVQLNLQMEDTTLEQWFKQTGKSITVSGGKMKVDAKITAQGTSMNGLAASVTGPVHIQIGAAKIFSPKAGQAEFWLTGLFSAKDSDRVDLSCISARLPFQSGMAEGEGIVGARSDVSQLLTRGKVDMRDQTLDLHGRVRARSGVNLGVSTFASEVKITGQIVKPEMSLDESGAVGAIARVGAAILTSGLSVVATSLWDGANPESDPCHQVFSIKAKAANDRDKRQSPN